MSKLRLSRGAATKRGKANSRRQGGDCLVDGCRRPPQTLGSSGEASLLDYGQQHQKLVYTRRSGSLHFEFPEKNLQYYPDFLSTESFLPSYRRFSFATDESGPAKGGCCKWHHGLIAGREPPQEPLKSNCFEE